MTRHFARSVFVVTLSKHRILVIFRATHSMSLRAQRGNLPEGNPFHKTHARYFCTCVEKKAHTSKRVSIIVYNNVISKAQLSGTPRDTVYPWGKGAHKQKSECYRLR